MAPPQPETLGNPSNLRVSNKFISHGDKKNKNIDFEAFN